MLCDTLERINRLRKQALANPQFRHSAYLHEKAIRCQESKTPALKVRQKRKKPKKLADIYTD